MLLLLCCTANLELLTKLIEDDLWLISLDFIRLLLLVLISLLLMPHIDSDSRLSCEGKSPVSRSGIKRLWLLCEELLFMDSVGPPTTDEKPIFGMDLIKRVIFLDAFVVVAEVTSAVRQLPILKCNCSQSTGVLRSLVKL